MQETIWKSMYLTLFSGILETQERLPMTPENAPAMELMNKALQDAEELYIAAGNEK